MTSFEDQVRGALERVGFQIDRLMINSDDSMATFWVRRGQPLAHLENLISARTALQAALTNSRTSVWRAGVGSGCRG